MAHTVGRATQCSRGDDRGAAAAWHSRGRASGADPGGTIWVAPSAAARSANSDQAVGRPRTSPSRSVCQPVPYTRLAPKDGVFEALDAGWVRAELFQLFVNALDDREDGGLAALQAADAIIEATKALMDSSDVVFRGHALLYPFERFRRCLGELVHVVLDRPDVGLGRGLVLVAIDFP
ncbi:MAG: hypothetical protein HY372_03815 [Candidatus Andersenbacteria bacterium]|nr:hypothetical protein [Candidatus Andersenbacteria bacterium]